MHHPPNNHSAFKGMLHKLFGSSQMSDQKEDMEIERRKIHREVFSGFPQDGMLLYIKEKESDDN